MVATSQVARVANLTLRKARRLFMQDQTRKGFYLLANEIQRLLQFHIAGDESNLMWADLAERIPLNNVESFPACNRFVSGE